MRRLAAWRRTRIQNAHTALDIYQRRRELCCRVLNRNGTLAKTRQAVDRCRPRQQKCAVVEPAGVKASLL